MTALWKQLKVGDRIRLVKIPDEFFQEGYFVHRDTMRTYKRLIARRRSLRICKIDENGFPWVEFRFRRKDGQWEWHGLVLNHDGIVKVRHRKKTA